MDMTCVTAAMMILFYQTGVDLSKKGACFITFFFFIFPGRKTVPFSVVP